MKAEKRQAPRLKLWSSKGLGRSLACVDPRVIQACICVVVMAVCPSAPLMGINPPRRPCPTISQPQVCPANVGRPAHREWIPKTLWISLKVLYLRPSSIFLLCLNQSRRCCPGLGHRDVSPPTLGAPAHTAARRRQPTIKKLLPKMGAPHHRPQWMSYFE